MIDVYRSGRRVRSAGAELNQKLATLGFHITCTCTCTRVTCARPCWRPRSGRRAFLTTRSPTSRVRDRGGRPYHQLPPEGHLVQRPRHREHLGTCTCPRRLRPSSTNSGQAYAAGPGHPGEALGRPAVQHGSFLAVPGPGHPPRAPGSTVWANTPQPPNGHRSTLAYSHCSKIANKALPASDGAAHHAEASSNPCERSDEPCAHRYPPARPRPQHQRVAGASRVAEGSRRQRGVVERVLGSGGAHAAGRDQPRRACLLELTEMRDLARASSTRSELGFTQP